MNQSNLHIVIGLGATGFSCVRYLSQKNIPVIMMDTREQPSNLAKFQHEYPEIPVYLGKQWPQDILNQAQCLVVSPGVSIALESIQTAKKHGVEIIGDIELFARENKVPVIAITGANGKSTVTTLVGEMAKACGKKVAVVGNIGTPVLDIFANAQDYDLIVMELSSFQLETTHSLRPLAATVLNISPDHLDRYPSIKEYIQAKHRIYLNAQNAVINKQDPNSDSKEIAINTKKSYFTVEKPLGGEFGLISHEGKSWLAYGDENLIDSALLKIVGNHNIANALCALALGTIAGLSLPSMLQALKNFKGLEHRCQWVAENNGVTWINDSKGTNIGATIAAIAGIGSRLQGKMVLLLGGDGKGADFTELSAMVRQYCRAIIVMGVDAPDILAALNKDAISYLVENMKQAVQLAKEIAQSQDVVLLSPACSSLDQYQNFSHRGDTFMTLVKEALGE